MTHHGAALHMLTKDDELVEQLKKDYSGADLDEKTMAILLYAEKLTLQPNSITDEDVNVLKEKGYSDRAILDMCQITAYFNFVNRLADGLGIQLEKE
ncbi:peroxidase [Salipaludibacillus keqinensis]|nr:peroxidase [Salipaludibacillus keqinensis]PYZ95205.1 peroxidase [Salipaludibacillus keqinensis]